MVLSSTSPTQLPEKATKQNNKQMSTAGKVLKNPPLDKKENKSTLSNPTVCEEQQMLGRKEPATCPSRHCPERKQRSHPQMECPWGKEGEAPYLQEEGNGVSCHLNHQQILKFCGKLVSVQSQRYTESWLLLRKLMYNTHIYFWP